MLVFAQFIFGITFSPIDDLACILPQNLLFFFERELGANFFP